MPEITQASMPIDVLEGRLLKQLEDMEYTQSTIRDFSVLVKSIKGFMKNEGFSDYSAEVGQEWLRYAACRQSNYPNRVRHRECCVRRMNDILYERPYQYLRDQTPFHVPPEYMELYDAYVQSIADKRQTFSTITHKKREASYFFNSLHALGCTQIGDVNARIISMASIEWQSTTYPTTVRDVLSFLLENGHIRCDYSSVVRKVRSRQPIPSVFSKEERRKIENVPDPKTVKGKRDKAMILLATRNGLRSGNIVGLKLDEIDFANDIMHIRKQVKTGKPINPALLPEVKRALQDYIENARPNVDSEYVFIRANAPHTKIGIHCLYNVMHRAIVEAGVEINGRRTGPHAMRASLTSSGINNGMTYEEMRVVNGHSDENAIKHYARLDDSNLRKCALDVPKPTGLFEKLLCGKEALDPL